MTAQSTFADLLRALAHERARVLVVGSPAKRVHGLANGSREQALWYDADVDNARCVYRALARVGAPLDGVELLDLADVDYAFCYGDGEDEIELVGGLDGVTFADAWPGRIETTWLGMTICVIGREALLAAERAAHIRV